MKLLLAAAIAEMINVYAIDAIKAFPAAVARIMLGWKAEPAVNAFASFRQKFCAVLGSLAMGVWAADVARSFHSTAPFSGLIAGAVAFNAQHIVTRLIVLSSPIMRGVERKLKKMTASDTKA